MNVATYHRVPSADETFGPEDLLALRVVRQRGWTLAASYTDDTGAGPRPGLQRLIADARRDRFEAIVVYSGELLFRSRRELEALLDELAVDLVSVLPLGAARRENRGRPPAEFDISRARALRLQGRTYAAIARELGVGQATVHRALVQTLVRKCRAPTRATPASTNSEGRVLELFPAAAPA